MNRLSKILAFALLTIGATLALIAIYSSQTKNINIEQSQDKVVAKRERVSMVVAGRDLPAGHYLKIEDLKTIEVEKSTQLNPENIVSPSILLGRTTAVEIEKDKPISQSLLIEGIAGFLASGERAVSIKVDEASAVGSKLKPGDWVDVFVVLRRDGQEVDSTQARMVLPRKKLIAFGAKTQVNGHQADSKDKDTSNGIARTAVIAVQVQEVNRLLLAEQQGQVQLALRSPLDQNEPSADMLQRIPGLNVAKSLNQNVSIETSALDASLLALKMSDLGSDNTAGSVKVVEQMNKKVGASKGASVEVIRGSRREMVRY